MKSLKLLRFNSLSESHLRKYEKCASGKPIFCTGTVEKHPVAFSNAFNGDREVL